MAGVSFVVLFIFYVGSCNFKFTRCLGGNDLIVRTSFHIFLAFFIISLFLFFITDKIFLKWLRFAAVWVILSITLIAITPEYPSGGIMSGPDRELVSIWLGGLFVVLSLGKIIWDVVRGKGHK